MKCLNFHPQTAQKFMGWNLIYIFIIPPINLYRHADNC